MDFKAGDVVRLNSGGPLMTLSSLTNSGSWEAYWFVEGDPKWHSFKPEMLKKHNSA